MTDYGRVASEYGTPVTLQLCAVYASTLYGLLYYAAAERKNNTYRSNLLRPRRGGGECASIFNERFKPKDWVVKSINLGPCRIDVGLCKMLLYGSADALRQSLSVFKRVHIE
jgi:hypothetical protein